MPAGDGARLVVTGCMAERYGDELAASLPEVDLVAPFGVPLAPPAALPPRPERRRPPRSVADPQAGPDQAKAPPPSFDLLNLPRPPATAPWAYIKVAEGCDRNCGFCAIPSFRGKQRSRPDAVDPGRGRPARRGTGALRRGRAGRPGPRLLWARPLRRTDRAPPRWPRRRRSSRPIVGLVRGAVRAGRARTRLLYLYPSSLDDSLIEAILATGVPYFDLSLQHVSRPLLKRMRRWGEGERFLDRIASIRRAEPTRRLPIVVHRRLSGRDRGGPRRPARPGSARPSSTGWASSPSAARRAPSPPSSTTRCPTELMAERLRECAELQDAITAQRRDALIGDVVDVLVDAPGEGRTYREAPEIDGSWSVPDHLAGIDRPDDR